MTEVRLSPHTAVHWGCSRLARSSASPPRRSGTLLNTGSSHLRGGGRVEVQSHRFPLKQVRQNRASRRGYVSWAGAWMGLAQGLAVHAPA